jgi:hypothetical protein
MNSSPSVLIITTQTWLQITRVALRFAAHGCRVSALCPEESHLTSSPQIAAVYRHGLLNPVAALRHAIQASHAEFLLPTDDLSVWLLHELAIESTAFAPLIERSLGSADAYPLLRSRFQLLELAHQLDIAVPRTELIVNIQDLEPWCAADAPAFVLKKDGTWGGGGVSIVRGPDQALAAWHRFSQPTSFTARAACWLRNGDASAFARLHCMSHPQITAQTLVRGIPANSMYACHQGRILGEVQAQVVASKGSTGPSFAIELVTDPRISRAGSLLAERLQLSGFFGLDFIVDHYTGEPFLIELNPRSTQLGHLAVPGQPGLTAMLWAQWTGNELPPSAPESLGRSIGFYPDTQQLGLSHEPIASFRSDLIEGEKELLSGLIFQHASRPRSLRRRLSSVLSSFKGSLQPDTTPQPFYHSTPADAQDEKPRTAGDAGPVSSTAHPALSSTSTSRIS